jgi:hypothetical protein
MTKARSNAVANAAKGDLTVGNGTDLSGILAVGSNGDTLVADSSTSTGLRYQVPVNANPVINSAFQVWQRGTSFAGGSVGYTADRWAVGTNGATTTASRQLTSDTTNLPNIQYCYRIGRNSGSTSTTRIEFCNNFETINSIPFAGKTVTLSFYARKGANFAPVNANEMSFGIYTGTGTDQNLVQAYTGASFAISAAASLTTTWQRFSVTGTLGATLNELSLYFYYSPTGTAGAADYLEITGVQLEVGSVATQFKTNGATFQGELAACQRYYWKLTGGGDGDAGNGHYYTSTGAYVLTTFPVVMRTTPTVAIENSANWMVFSAGTGRAVSAFAFSTAEPFNFTGSYTTSAATAGNGCWVEQTNANAALTFSAEL